MAEKITILIASVLEREHQLKIVLNRIASQIGYHNIDVHVVLNFYDEIPIWAPSYTIFCKFHLNPTNKKAHDAIWEYVPKDGYVFVMDDDIYYPLDYFDKLIKALRRHEHKAVCTCHGSNIQLPAKDYMESRQTWGFTDSLDRDIFNDLAGVGCCAFHTDTIRPQLSDFPIQFMRDMFFSALCLKKGMKIINIQRDADWLRPMHATGETVYDVTYNNEGLRELKNTVFKDRFLPALNRRTNGLSDQYVLIQHTGDGKQWHDLLSTTMRTLVDVNPNVNIIVFSDQQKDFSFWDENYLATVKRPVLTRYITPKEMAIGQMGCKMVTQYGLIQTLPEGSQVISADADLYFLRDPFKAFDWFYFDIGVTTRCEPYKYPINSGVVMFNVNRHTDGFLAHLTRNVYAVYGHGRRTWDALEAFEKKHGHDAQANRNSWYCDQDAWCVAYEQREGIARNGTKIVDVGPYWNFCPHADGDQTASGKAKLLRAYHDESVGVLHLKSQLKSLLFEGLLP